MKKAISAALCAVVLIVLSSTMLTGAYAAGADVSVWDGTSGKSIATGSGTEADPYVITDAAELDYIATACMGGDTFADKYIVLDVNIDWGGREWTSIGYSSSAVFSGSFDGNGKTIFNLTCQDVTVGIFGYATAATIKNLNVDYASFTTDTRYAGAIVGLLRDSQVSGCSAGLNASVKTTDIMSNTAQIGGLFGLVNNSFVDSCSFEGEVVASSITGTSFVGGIAGVIGNNSEVSFCINNGSVSVTNACIAAGSYAYAGGISGCIGSSKVVGSIKNCINNGDVSAVEYAGGVLGRIHVADSTMTDCYSTGTVSSSGALAGAVVGELPYSGTVSGCYGAGAEATYAKLGDGISFAADAMKTASAIEIKALDGYKNAQSNIAANLPLFDAVMPSETTSNTTVSQPDTETASPETDTQAPADTETASPETEAPTQATTTTSQPQSSGGETAAAPEKSGCGGSITLAGGSLLVCAVMFGAVLLGKDKNK